MTATVANPRGFAPAQTLTSTRALLACGVLAGPLFTLAVLIQMATRDGFDPRKHPLSMLSLSDLGWIQITNFVACGVLAVAGAVGMRRVLRGGRAGTWGPILFATYGISLIWGGVFVADPAFGYPVGTPDAAPEQLSWHGMLHGIAPAVAGIGLIAACIVFARRYLERGERGWAGYCIAAAVAYLGLAVAAFPTGDYRWMLAGGAIIWTWAAAVTLRTLTRGA